MKALTIWQPWAHGVAHLGKNPENRTQPTNHRGEVWLHAARRDAWDLDGQQDHRMRLAWNRWAINAPGLNLVGPLRPDSLFISFSAFVAVADLTDCHPAGECADRGGRCHPWGAAAGWHWVFDRVRPLARPVPHRGFQGLWTVPAELEPELRAAMAG